MCTYTHIQTHVHSIPGLRNWHSLGTACGGPQACGLVPFIKATAKQDLQKAGCSFWSNNSLSNRLIGNILIFSGYFLRKKEKEKKKKTNDDQWGPSTRAGLWRRVFSVRCCNVAEITVVASTPEWFLLVLECSKLSSPSELAHSSEGLLWGVTFLSLVWRQQ